MAMQRHANKISRADARAKGCADLGDVVVLRYSEAAAEFRTALLKPTQITATS